MVGRGNKSMGKYAIKEHWPSDLKIMAANVKRAKMERKFRKAAVLTGEGGQALKNRIDRYIEADTEVRRAKARFEEKYCEYQQIGEVAPR